jgi:hypothetical protein
VYSNLVAYDAEKNNEINKLSFDDVKSLFFSHGAGKPSLISKLISKRYSPREVIHAMFQSINPFADLSTKDVSETSMGSAVKTPPPSLPPPSDDLIQAAADAIAIVQGRKIAISQVVKFAGKQMTVTKIVTAGTEGAKAALEDAKNAAARAQIHAASNKAVAGDQQSGISLHANIPSTSVSALPVKEPSISLDSVLANLDKPETISTLQKTSLDWDQYKVATGTSEDLERAAKGGFVEKQAFLSRVDNRTYEMGREKRARERALNPSYQ